MAKQLYVAGLPRATEDGCFDIANANKSRVRVHGGQSSEFPIYPTTRERTINSKTRAVLRLVWPPILLLFIEQWRHLADSNEPNLIKKHVFLNLLNLIGSLGHHQNFTHC